MEDLWARACRDLVAGVEGDWREVVFRTTFDGPAMSWRTASVGGRVTSRDMLRPDTRDALVERFGHGVLELTVHAGGAFEAVLTRELSQHTAYLPPTYGRVLDPGFRPDRPEPPPSAPAPAGDPARVPDLVAEFAALTGWRAGEPASPGALAAAEAALGLALPDDLRALHLLADGDTDDPGPTGLWRWPVAQLAEQRDSLADLAADLDPDPSEPLSYRGPADAVRVGWRHPGWVPLATDRDLQHLVVDLAPGPAGHPGQVLLIDHQESLVQFVAPSVTDRLADVVARLRAGDDELWTFPTGGAPEIALNTSPAGTDLATALAGVDEPELLRVVRLRDAGDADLTPPASLPALELLEVTAPRVDLSPPAGLRPRSVTIAGGAAVEVPAWDGLVELDLGGATATNLHDLPAAPLLTPRDEQWRLLDRPPEGLAVARPAGQGSPARAVEWAGWLCAPVAVEVVRSSR